MLIPIVSEHSLTTSVIALSRGGTAYSIGYFISMLLLVVGVTGLFLCPPLALDL